MKLTQRQEEEIRRLFKQNPDLMWITRELFGDKELDGRSKEGRAVREYLRSLNKDYKTIADAKRGEKIDFTQDQIDYLMSNDIDADATPLEITRLIFKDRSIKSLSSHHRAVIDFFKEVRPDYLNAKHFEATDVWTPPYAMSHVLGRVNKFTVRDMKEEDLNPQQRQCLERLKDYMQSPRMKQTINSYSRQADRDLFEAEFVRAAWDKPDLNNDEINSYINVCMNYIRLKDTQFRFDKLNRLAESINAEDQTMRFNEAIKVTGEELNQIEKRISDALKILNGTRADRMKKRVEDHGNITALIDAFKNKEERDRMIMMANRRVKANEDKLDEIETMDDFKMRILGISKRELI